MIISILLQERTFVSADSVPDEDNFAIMVVDQLPRRVP